MCVPKDDSFLSLSPVISLGTCQPLGQLSGWLNNYSVPEFTVIIVMPTVTFGFDCWIALSTTVRKLGITNKMNKMRLLKCNEKNLV